MQQNCRKCLLVKRYDDWSLGNHGLNITEPFDTFWNGFPEEILIKIEEFSGRKVIREANKPYQVRLLLKTLDLVKWKLVN